MQDRLFNARQTRLFTTLLFVGMLVGLSQTAAAGEPDWIWTPKTSVGKTEKRVKDCYFRKKLTLVGPQKAQLVFAAGDEYSIYLNDQLAARGQSFGKTQTVDVSRFIQPGVNLVAVHVRHYDSVQPGLALKFRVKEKGETRWRSLQTDSSWKTRVVAPESWTESSFNDLGWIAAKQTSAQTVVAAQQKVLADKAAAEQLLVQQQALEIEKQKAILASAQQQAAAKKTNAELASKLQSSLPQMGLNVSDAPPSQPAAPVNMIKSKPMKVAAKTSSRNASANTKTTPSNQLAVVRNKSNESSNKKTRFQIDPDFKVEKIMTGKETGSLIAMEFNEFGKLLLSREGGPLMIADPNQPAESPSRIRVYCDQVNSCQGILPLNGKVYVTALAKAGSGLYELADSNKDGQLTIKRKLLSFTGEPGEHGPHGIQLGPDGMLYVILGNGSQVEQPVVATSPFKNFYEGDLVPRFEDPSGHANGVKAPGGTIVRVSLDGKKIERVAGGIRNAYDMVIDGSGEMFLHDSDMESDMGTTWYRPTMAFHVPAGAELGWRSGWAKFPNYFIDQMPAMADTGRGSPTGAIQYQHVQFPQKYHGSIFFADWSEGRILSMKPQPNGAGFVAKPKTFMQGRPMNVCDLAVGEDGGLYFCTGGRGTEGGVYRVSWNGKTPDELLQFDNLLVKAIRQPQPQSAWARQNIARIRIEMGEAWGPGLEAVAKQTRNEYSERLRALQLMAMFGPRPSQELLETLAQDEQPAIRAQIARMCVRKPDDFKNKIVTALVSDASPYVRRVACECCVRMDVKPSFDALVPMLSSADRVESLAARRLLERLPMDQWQQQVLSTENKNVLFNGSIALLTADPTLERSYEILAACSHLMDGFLNDREFTDLLRTVQLALVQGQVSPERVPGLTRRIANEFPSASSTINRELARVLGYLKAGDFNGRLTEYLNNEKVNNADKVHVAMFMLNGQSNLTSDEQLAVLDALETSRTAKNVGGSYAQYVKNAIAQVAGTVAGNDIQTVLANGHRWPKTVLSAFYKLPEKLDTKTVSSIIEMDKRMVKKASDSEPDYATTQVRLGTIALLARDGSEPGMEYLRELWQQEPQRRSHIIVGLAQQPAGKNWAYLVGSLPELDDLTSAEVLQKLTTVSQRPREAKYYRQVIELGYRLRGKGALAASELINHWSGAKKELSADPWQNQLASWDQWYQQQFPQSDAISKGNNDQTIGRYSVASVVDQLNKQGLGDAARGRHVFAKANCTACHRHGDHGQAIGPELTNLAARFSLRETIEATIDPSAIVPDRYKSKTILTIDGMTHEGMAIAQADGSYVLLDRTGKRISIAANEIEDIKETAGSSMPEGLLDQLSVSEVSDLMAYLMGQSQSSLAEKSQQPKARISAMPAVQKVR